MGRNPSDRADRKLRIVDAAVGALRRHGLPPLSYDLVAQEAGLTRQAVRNHFPETESLMLAVCDRLAEAYRTALVENAARLQGPERIDMFLNFYFDLLDGTAKPRDDAVYDAMMSLATGSGAIRRALGDQYRLLGKVMCHEFKISHPQLSLRAAEELSYLFVCLMYGHWKMVATLGMSEHHNRLSRDAMSRLIRSYCSDAGPEQDRGEVWGTGT